MNITKIAYELYAKNFEELNEKDRKILHNPYEIQPEYIIFKNKPFIVLKLKRFKDVKKSMNISENVFINAVISWKLNEIKELNIVEKEYVFQNIKELYGHFVNKEKMEEQEFQKYFNTNYSETKKLTYKNIDITVEKGFKRFHDIKSSIDKVLKLKYKDLFKGLLINFKSKITERDSDDVRGNRVSNQYGYKNVINIGDYDVLFTLFHELGHIYQEKYLTKDEIEKIYDHVLTHNDTINCTYGDLFLQEDDCIPEFFANYYTNELNKESKKFVEQYILK